MSSSEQVSLVQLVADIQKQIQDQNALINSKFEQFLSVLTRFDEQLVQVQVSQEDVKDSIVQIVTKVADLESQISDLLPLYSVID